MGFNRDSTLLFLLIILFLCLNSSLNLLNKWALGHHGLIYPLMLTSTHMAFSFIVLSPFALRMGWDTHQHTLQKQWKGILYIGSFMALNISLNNLSLLDISLSLNQIIRAAIPVATCILRIVVEGIIPSRLEATSLVVLTSGVMLAVWQGALSGKPHAIALCIIATICNGAMMTFAGKLLSEKLDVVRLTFYTAPVSLTCLAPFYFKIEHTRFLSYFQHHHNGVIMIVLISSINAVCYNLVHALIIKKTSATTSTVLGEVKIVGLLILSAFLLGESKEFTLKMACGCALALIGFFMYSHTKIVASRESTKYTKLISVEDEPKGSSMVGWEKQQTGA
jgi:drug/metabolite transporter (DMT)-like permease